MTVKLEVTKREESAGKIRQAGRVPGIVYGPKQEAIQLSVDGLAFKKLLEGAGESTIITLEGLDESLEVLIQDVAFNAARGGAEHVDFYAIERGKELTTNVALEFVGEAPATKSGATVTKAVQELEVTCLPRNLPGHIVVDVSVLVDEGSQIKISDLEIPEGVTLTLEPETIIANVAAAREEEPEEVVEVDMDAIEVEEKGKKEGEEEPEAEEAK